MMIWVAVLIILSCYVGNSSMPDESKNSYYIILVVAVILTLLFKIF